MRFRGACVVYSWCVYDICVVRVAYMGYSMCVVYACRVRYTYVARA